MRRKVSSHAKLPKNWMDFLRDQNNKKELFALLTSKVIEFVCPPSKVVYVTSGERVISAGSDMTNCNHEEADTRAVVHILNALEQGMKSVKVRTVDTDVVIILAGAFYELCQTQPLADIWIAFGMSKNYRFYSINAICASLGEQRSRALPVFHTLTGCDTMSAFKGEGKKSAWQAWQAYEEVTETLEYLASNPFEILDVSTVNEVREELFCWKNRSVDRIPPTQDALLQHV